MCLIEKINMIKLNFSFKSYYINKGLTLSLVQRNKIRRKKKKNF